MQAQTPKTDIFRGVCVYFPDGYIPDVCFFNIDCPGLKSET